MSYLGYRNPIYDLLEIHNLMLSDSIRTGTYARAIKANVKEGDIVVDVGTGTGILALLAAKAGAKKVYAIETTEIIQVAKQITMDNGLEDQIIFMNCNAEEAEIPEQVDCIVSEWMGVFGLQENMLPAVISIRDRYLKSDGKILPHDISLFAALVSSDNIYNEAVKRWRQPFYGLDYHHFADCNANDTHLVTARPDELGSEPVKLMDVDCRNARPQRQYRADIRLITTKNSDYQGILGWFKANFPGDITLDTSPCKSSTHWQQLFFPFSNPIELEEKEEVNLSFEAKRDNQNHRLMHFNWNLKI